MNRDKENRTMRGWKIVICVPLVALAALSTGCNDQLKAKEAHIALLEDTNQRLTDQLAGLRSQSELEDADLQGLRRDLSRCKENVSSLQTQLAAKPAAADPSGWQAVPGGTMIAIEGNVLFAPGKVDLRKAGAQTLDSVVSAINSQYADKDIFVFGHTDDAPIKKSGWKDNFELSAQRGLTVVRYLVERGVSPSRVVACGAGKYRPRIPNSDDSSRAKNRRVEIFAVDPSQ
jgi:chemotaxis protein MotB